MQTHHNEHEDHTSPEKTGAPEHHEHHPPEAHPKQDIPGDSGAHTGHGRQIGASGETGHSGQSEHGGQSGHSGQSENGSHTGGSIDHSGHENMFRSRFWVCLVLSLPVLAYSEMLQMWFSFTMPDFPGSRWVGPFFSIAVFLYGGLPFLRMAVPEFRNRKPGIEAPPR